MQRTILVVDDDPKFLCDAEATLTEVGYRVLLAQRISQALELTWALNAELDAAMIDLVLANESGFDALHLIKSILPDVPVIVFSGCANDTDFAVARRLGAVATIRKPIADEWMSAIRAVVG